MFSQANLCPCIYYIVCSTIQYNTIQYNTIQYNFYCQLPMGAFQRQVLIVQVIKKKKKKVSQIDYQ